MGNQLSDFFNLPEPKLIDVAFDERESPDAATPAAFAQKASEVGWQNFRIGTWRYIGDDNTLGPVQGWYLWVPDEKLLGVSNVVRVDWETVSNFDAGLTQIANRFARDK